MNRYINSAVKKSVFLYLILNPFWRIFKKITAIFKATLFRFLSPFYYDFDIFSEMNVSPTVDLRAYFREREKAKFFFEFGDMDFLSQAITKEYRKQIKTEAKEIIEHKFRVLGKIIYFKNGIDWHKDKNSGYKWPLKYYKRLFPVFNTMDNTDAKYPYELSRFIHLNMLGIAYRLNGDERYAQEFLSEVDSWINSNPFMRGINWTCTMDVSIRVCNLISSIYFFMNSNVISNSFFIKLLTSIIQHGKYIFLNLENTGNHYIADLTGLFYISLCLPEIKETLKWKNFTKAALIKEMEKQVFPDGCHFEASTCYHRLVLELFFFTTVFAVKNDVEFNGENYIKMSRKIFGDEYTNKLYKMFEGVLYLIKPNGFMPQIGDNDNGRLHVYANNSLLDMRYLLTYGSIFFKEKKFKIREFGFCEEALWLFGKKGYQIWENLVGISIRELNSKSFHDSGWYVIRHSDKYCLISCGTNRSSERGGHAHNDKLSFELSLNGQDVIVDPGTYVYTSQPEERNKFRSTSYHNTAKFYNFEQNEISKRDIFTLKNDVEIRASNMKILGEDIVFEGIIQYARITHKRSITFKTQSGEFHIQDKLSSLKPLKAKIFFHFSPKVTVSNQKILVKQSNEILAEIEIEKFKIFKEDYDYSPEYGKKVKAECLVVDIDSKENEIEVNSFIIGIK